MSPYSGFFRLPSQTVCSITVSVLVADDGTVRSSFVRVSIPGLADFCFPSGILSKKLRKTKSNSSLLQVVYSQSYHHEPENAYVFLLTTAEREFLYGVCVIKHESVYVRGLLLSLHTMLDRYFSRIGLTG